MRIPVSLYPYQHLVELIFFILTILISKQSYLIVGLICVSLVSKFSQHFWCNYLLFPYRSVGKESACNSGDPGFIPGLGRSPGERNGNPLQYSCLENPRDRGAWQATVHGATRVGHDLLTLLLLTTIHFFNELYTHTHTNTQKYY